jgi:hypothetical protein
MKKLFAVLFVALTAVLAGCGGGGGGGAGTTQTNNSSGQGSTSSTPPSASLSANQVALTVDSSMGAYNRPYVSVTVCTPGTSQCATVDHVLVDTGSVGLRLKRSVLPGSLSLPSSTDAANGSPLAECAEFASGHLWGPVVTADVKMASETASSISMQIIDDSFSSVPASCSEYGGSIASDLGANGVIGLENLLHDCDSSAECGGPGVTTYFDCNGSNCSSQTPLMQIANEIPNPVSKFATDNTGIVVTFPSVPAGGSRSVSGVLTFGINSQSDNQIGSQTQLQVSVAGYVKATYDNQLDWAFLDTGSTTDYFTDSSIPTCSDSFFCPGSSMTVSPTLSGISGTSQVVNVNIGNGDSEVGNGNAAFSDVGQSSSFGGEDYFDLGLPFFFGKSIYFGYPSNELFEGTWPYVAIQG